MGKDRLHLKQLFLEHIALEFSNQQQIYTDGSKDQNNVVCAALSNATVVKRRLNLENTIFTAELYALLKSLIIVNNSAQDKLIILSDSKSAI